MLRKRDDDMYKHMAESILETNEKRFISQSDKEKYDNYVDNLILAENAVTREEFNKVIENMEDHEREYSGEFILAEGTKPGFLNGIEIYGNTIQPIETIEVTPEMEDNALHVDTGENYELADNSRTKEFIPVKCGDKITFINDISSEENMANLFFYDENKKVVSNLGFVISGTVPYGAVYARYYHKYGYTISKLCIERQHLDQFKSVGTDLGDGTFRLGLESRGNNILKKSDIIIGKGYPKVDSESLSSDPTFAVTDYIKVKPGGTYYKRGNSGGTITHFYNNEKQWLPEYSVKILEGLINIPEDASYIRTNTRAINVDTLMIIACDTVEYTEFQSSCADINLPIQLESVGKVSDKLFKRADGVWCIEKNIKSAILDKQSWHMPQSGNDYSSGLVFAYCNFNDLRTVEPTEEYLNVISDKFKPSNQVSDGPAGRRSYEFIGGYYGGFNSETENWLYIKISINRLEGTLTGDRTNDNALFTECIRNSNVNIKYISRTPEIIELPLETQLVLNSFNDATNIFATDTEIDPIIKCKAPVSLGSSIVSNIDKLSNIDDRIEKIESLEKSSRIMYSSDRGAINIEKSNNGTIDDIEIQGITLINRAINVYDTETDTEIVRAIEHISSDGEYTIINNSLHDINLMINVTGGDWKRNVVVEPNSSSIIKLEGETCVAYTAMKSDGYTLSSANEIKVVILEGAYKDFMIPYFTGMISTGEDELKSLSIVSRNESGNLFPIREDEFRFTPTIATWYDLKGVEFMYGDMSNKTDTAFYLEKGNYKLSYGNTENIDSVQLVNINGVVSLDNDLLSNGTGYIPEGYYLIRVKATLADVECVIKNILLEKEEYYTGVYKQIEKTEKPLLYLDHEDNTYKQIPVLRRIDSCIYDSNGNISGQSVLYDSIEKQDNNWYYYKRCTSFIIDGSTPIVMYPEMSTNDYTCFYTDNIPLITDTVNITTNIFKYKRGFNSNISHFNEEGVWTGISGTADKICIRVKIANSRLSSIDVEGIKSWLSSHPITVLCELAKEEVYEVAPLSLQTYSGETSVSLNTVNSIGSINFTTAKYIGDLVLSLRTRASKMQEYIINRAIYQNRMMLNNVYSADMTSLKVDISTFSSDTTSNLEDIELYNLIRKNILVGKTNYDRTDMENLIDFYTMVGKLSFDMAEDLFTLISDQWDISQEEI